MSMVILGIDPGFARVGYSLLEKNKGELKVLDFGCISTDKETEFCDRLLQIEADLDSLIANFKPTHLAIEDLFFFKNSKTVMPVASARGVLMLAAKKRGVEVWEYTPLQIKQALTGYGRADKTQVMEMVKRVLKIKSKIKLDDTSDALAVAVCHAHSLK